MITYMTSVSKGPASPAEIRCGILQLAQWLGHVVCEGDYRIVGHGRKCHPDDNGTQYADYEPSCFQGKLSLSVSVKIGRLRVGLCNRVIYTLHYALGAVV